MEREVHFKEATEKVRQAYENAEKRAKNLEEENTRLRQNTAANKSSVLSKQGSYVPVVMSTEEKSGMDGVSHDHVEEYLNIISRLSQENVSAKGGELRRRVKDLDQAMPEFAKCMQRLSVGSSSTNKPQVSDNEKVRLGQIVNRVNEVGRVCYYRNDINIFNLL